jgi:RNA polymerase sigma factor (sigma-70 family)
MPQGRKPHLLCHLTRVLSCQGSTGVSDTELLDRFVRTRDEAAFELLVYRHGAMVLGVCRRVLRDAQEAEDAFQATWLALARKAGGIGKRQSLSSWLFKVAYRASLRARSSLWRGARWQPPRLPRQQPENEPERHLLQRELRDVLDEELSRLPERYRAPLVLCYLQEKTNAEAARLLRWPVGTVKTRLARGRELLSSRLTRRGLAVPATAMALGLARERAAASLTPALAGVALRGALALLTGSTDFAVSTGAFLLTQGVLKTMFLDKVKLAAVITMVLGILATGGLLGHRALGARADTPGQSQSPQNEQPVSGRKNDGAEWKRAEQSLDQLRHQLTYTEAALNLLKFQIKAEEARLEQLRQGRRSLSVAEEERAGSTVTHDPGQAVAYVFGTPISREELGDYLVDRLGAERLEQLVNLRIIEHACRQRGIEVGEAEIQDALVADLQNLKIGQQQFEQQVLRSQHKSLHEWKQDVLRPRLLLARLLGDRAQPSEQEIRETYEARYGERVICEFRWHEPLKKGGDGPSPLPAAAPVPRFGSLEYALTRTEPIGRHSTGNAAVEKAIFALQPGESTDVSTTEGNFHVRCVRRLPPDPAVKLEDVRTSLAREVRERKLQAAIPRLFQELRDQAQPRLILRRSPAD